MPIYSYKCNECGTLFDLLVGVTAGDKEKKCKKCSSTDIVKQLTTFSVRNSSSSDSECSTGSCATGTCPTCF